MYEARVGSPLYAVARRVRQLLAHKLIYAQGLLTLVGLKAKVLIQLLRFVVKIVVVVVVIGVESWQHIVGQQFIVNIFCHVCDYRYCKLWCVCERLGFSGSGTLFVRRLRHLL